jgi:hypothetical protein
MGPHHRTPPKCASNPPSVTPPTEPNEARRDEQIHRRTPLKRNHTRVMEPLCCELLLY